MNSTIELDEAILSPDPTFLRLFVANGVLPINIKERARKLFYEKFRQGFDKPKIWYSIAEFGKHTETDDYNRMLKYYEIINEYYTDKGHRTNGTCQAQGRARSEIKFYWLGETIAVNYESYVMCPAEPPYIPVFYKNSQDANRSNRSDYYRFDNWDSYKWKSLRDNHSRETLTRYKESGIEVEEYLLLAWRSYVNGRLNRLVKELQPYSLYKVLKL